MAEIVLDNVVKRYPDGALAVDNFNLTIADGEFIILVGPSGCGKSTTLNMVAGLEDITQGELRIDGEVVNDKAPKDRDIAMVFQSYALYPHMTVGENMGFPLKLAGVDKATIQKKVHDAAEMLELTQHLDRKPSNLSGGQRQRVAMGRAIVRQPKAFLMDEPLSNLDAKLRLEMRTEIRRLHQALGLTTVYVTHDQEEALSMADRLVVLRKGVAQQIGTPQELHTRPANWHVADFMGFRNLLQLTVARVDGDHVVVEGKGLRLAATSMAPLEAGDAVVAAVRPEDLVVHVGGGEAPGSSVEAVVEVVEYQGRELAVEARTREGQRLHVRTVERLAPGDEVTLSVEPDKLLAYARGAEAPPEPAALNTAVAAGSPS